MACQLNEEEEGVAPTDSRRRPDQRLMEVGEWDEANTEKVRLEEKQRAARRHRDNEALLAAERGKQSAARRRRNARRYWQKRKKENFV